MYSKQKLVRNKVLGRIFFTTLSKPNVVFSIKSHFEDLGYKLHLLDHGPSQTVELTKGAALKYYRQMDLIRKMETENANLYMKKTMRGFCHLYVGQEAIAVGMNSVLRPQDTIITSYRCHGWAVLKCSLLSVFAEIIGNISGTSRGKGGSIHIFGPNFYGGNGIVGAQIPLGVGLALNHKYSGSDAISLAICGEGAANQGQIFESYNMAKLHMLPVVFVIENNNYAMGTATCRSSANPEHYRQCAYIPGIRVNGNEILSVIEVTKFALNHISDGKGPIILEMMTYRYFGHSMSDPGSSYRSRNEVKQVREQQDPLKHLRLLILDSNLATAEEVKQIQNENQKVVREALEAALKGKTPPIEELTGDCYSTYPEPIRTSKMLTYSPHKHFGKYKEQKK